MSTQLADLRAQLPELMVRDEHRLRRKLDSVRRARDPRKRQSVLDGVASEIVHARSRVDSRVASVPPVAYPGELPVSARVEDIAAAIRDNQVVVVAGETGSGKTTQLPKICLELGRGVRGMIGHTQPRRLAARTVAERISSELDTDLGETVGYQMRFSDTTGPSSLLKVMTDGILLAEIGADPWLRRYDTLIIDEAHERSLNIDFILGYLTRVLPRRPDMKVIITSATIDPDRFAKHFAAAGLGDVPVVEVSGRTYPVEVRYRPLQVEAPSGDGTVVQRDQTQAICDAVHELVGQGPGDVLVFLSGEREIRDTADALERENLRGTEILPLFARLSSAEQRRVFSGHRGRRIVLATNVAETSLTVPGIKYVIDPGTARISRYSHRTKVQRLPIEPISQASANQRKGRCGRTSDGICIRLYSEADFLSRQEFTDPEILRTNLASVILQLAALDLGELSEFPFVEPPEKRSVQAGVQLLEELGALERSGQRLTDIGRKLAALPLDPRLARMVLEAERNGCVREVMIIASALSIQDPRERPADKQQAADEKHARFSDERSDFMAYLNLWRYVRGKQRELSGNQFRKLCRDEFLNFLRSREWQDIDSQLRQVVKSLGISVNTEDAEPDKIHTALLSGMLSHIGLKEGETREYLGARGTKFAIFPGSVVAKKPPRWVMAAELVETSRLWGRVVARIEPEWIEPLAGHLVKRNYSEPHWEAKRASVLAYERVTLYGVPIVASRKVQYGRIEPELCRELFIRRALVEGDWTTNHRFFHANRAMLGEVKEWEERARRRDIVVDDETLFEFYDARIGSEVVSGKHFDSWWKKTRRHQPDLLDFSTALLTNTAAEQVREGDYPDEWWQGELTFPLSYQFEPGSAADGVTVSVPLAQLNQVDVADFDWQVPGLREELLTALLKSLPKPVRRTFVPVPDHARAVLDRVRPRQEPMLDAVERELRAMAGTAPRRADWNVEAVPAHLRMTFRILDDEENSLGEGKDLRALRERFATKVRESIANEAEDVHREGLRSWNVGELPRVVTRGKGNVKGYPALVDTGDAAAVRVFDTPRAQAEQMWRGTRRLLLLEAPAVSKTIQRGLSNSSKLVLANNPHGGVGALLDDCIACSVDGIVAQAGGPAWDEAGFARLAEKVRAGLGPTVMEVLGAVERVLASSAEARRALDAVAARPGAARYDAAVADMREQLAGLVYPGFVTGLGVAHLGDVPRYLAGITQRAEKLPANTARDTEWMAAVYRMWEAYRERCASQPRGEALPREIAEVPWMIEELRVSFFAQSLGTAHPVSEKRIRKVLAG